MSAHLLPGVRGLFLNNKINAHKTDDHMQTTEGPKELTKNPKKNLPGRLVAACLIHLASKWGDPHRLTGEL